MNIRKVLDYGLIAVVLALAFTACKDPEPAHDHQWGDWNVTTAANCTTTGSQTRTCALDATHTETEVIPINDDHDWGEWEGTVTCTEAGTGTRVCSRNETHIETNDNLQPLGHNYEYEETTAPTCTTAGVETGTCTHDNAHTTTRTVAIDPDAHDYQWLETTPPTSFAEGVEIETCKHNPLHTNNTRTIPSLISQSLKTQAGTKESPAELSLDIDLGNMTVEGSNWMKLLDIIAEENKYVTLDLSASTGIEEFNPGTANTGEKMIVSLVLPNMATSIVDSTEPNPTFRYFTSLNEVTGLNVINTGRFAFYGCRTLTEASFPTATSIDYCSFYACDSLKETNFPAVTSIGSNAFRYCRGLTEISFPSATNIDSAAFDSCRTLIEVSFPATAEIGSSVFLLCNNITNFNLTGTGSLSVFENGKALVRDNTELLAYPSASGNIVMSNITVIGNGAFEGCASLTGISFPSLNRIDGSPFGSCKNLTEVSIPADTNIGYFNNPFRYCNSITNFNLTGTGSLSLLENGKALVRDNTILIAYPSASGSVAMDIITSITNEAFSGCTNLTEVSFPAVTHIEIYAFSGCTSLTEISIPAADYINHYAFGYSPNQKITKITLGTITEQGFATNIGIPGNIRNVYFDVGGGAGTYTRESGSDTWTKQP